MRDRPGPPLNERFTINRNSPQAKGLVAWWPMCQYGTTFPLRDLCVGRNMVAYNGPIWIADSQFGQAILLDDASSQVCRVTTPPPPVIATPVTLCCWAKTNDVTISQYAFSICRWDDAGNSFSIGIDGAAAGDPVFARTSAADVNSSANSTTGVTVNKWHHICGVFESASSRIAYIDGGNPGSNTATRTPTGLNAVVLGDRMFWEGCDAPFSGCLIDARIYNRVLSSAEVWQLYDPATKWDLYLPLPRCWYIPTAVTPHSIVDAGDIASDEVEGQPTISSSVVGAGGIVSDEASGQPDISVGVTGAGAITSGEAAGQPTVSASITGIGNIASEEAEGQPAISTGIVGAGDVSSEEAEGQPIISSGIVGAGNIASSEAEGQPTISSNIVGVGGIASNEAYGQPDVSLSIIGAGGITSTEAFGLATITVTGDITGVGGIISAEAEGQPVISAVVGGAGGIPSAEAVEQPAVIAVITGAGGISSSETFGNPLLYTTITGAGNIPSTETFGNPALIWNGEIIGAGGMPSGEAFGNPVLTWTAIPTPVPPASAAHQPMSPKWGWEPAPIKEYPWMRRIVEPGVDDEEETLILLVHEMHKKGSI